MTVVAVSGGFDPLHTGHGELLKCAKKLGDRLVVILNNDHWLKKKKGYVFMGEYQRMEMLYHLRYVDEVILTEHLPDDDDRSVCKVLNELKPDIFANGGDRYAQNIPEYSLCDELGIVMAFNVGGGKTESSSELVKRLLGSHDVFKRPWGEFHVCESHPSWTLKTLRLAKNEAISLQRHRKREEFWMLVAGTATAVCGKSEISLIPFTTFHIPQNAVHRLTGGPSGCVVVEVMKGVYDEEDIERFEDKYGRL